MLIVKSTCCVVFICIDCQAINILIISSFITIVVAEPLSMCCIWHLNIQHIFQASLTNINAGKVNYSYLVYMVT